MTVLASVPNPAGPPGTVFQDTSTKTWEAGGPENVESLECTPATDSNPEGSEHRFTCTARTATGTPAGGILPFFDVTAGPNAEEVGPTPCTFSGANGQSECAYTDVEGAGSPPGTDTLTVYVNLTCPRPGVPECGPGPDADETQTTVTKTFHGPARVIDCEPEQATNRTRTTHEVTCTVTDRAGVPVSGVEVTFDETGPGRFTTGEQEDDDTTNANGVATADVTASREEKGDQTITGSLDVATTDCELPADDPPGEEPPAAAGVCSDDVTKTWRPRPNRAESSVTIRGSFKGQVVSERRGCKVDRKVILKKVRPGKNKKVGTDRTNKFGNWRINKKNPKGRYYAKIRRTLRCTRDKSPTVRKR